MALGLTSTDAAPIQVGRVDPILATASVIASNVMLKMAASPRPERLAAMTSMLNGLYPGMGTKAQRAFLDMASRRPSSQMDQAMFDAVRGAIADRLVGWTVDKMSTQRGAGGLGQTSQTMTDVNSAFCSFGAGGTSLIGGFVDAFRSGGAGGQTGSIQAGAATAGTIAGCNVAGIDAQTRLAEAQGRTAQSVQMQQAAMLAAQEDRQFRYLLLGGGGLVTLIIGAVLLKK